MVDDYRVTDFDPSAMYLKEVMDMEKHCIELQIQAQHQLSERFGMPKAAVMAYHHAVRTYYTLLKPILHDEDEEPLINRFFDETKHVLSKLQKSQNFRAENRRSTALFDHVNRIFETLLEFKNKHDLSFKNKRLY
jgi:hypothetical protein